MSKINLEPRKITQFELQNVTHIEVSLSPFAENIKATIKLFSQEENDGLTRLNSKTAEFLLNRDSQDQFKLFLGYLSDDTGIPKGVLEVGLCGMSEFPYEDVIGRSIVRTLTANLQTGEICSTSHKSLYAMHCHKDDKRIPIPERI